MKLRRVITIVTVILLTGGGATGGYIYYRYQSKIKYSGTIRFGAVKPITITRDVKGVPRITCADHSDFYFALGYLHAQDRLDGISYLKMMVRGRAEKVIKEDAETINRFILGAGFYRKAGEIVAAMPQRERDYLKRYVQGINTCLSTNTKIAPDYQEQWAVEDPVAIYLMKSWIASFLNNRETTFQIPFTGRTVHIRDLFPDNLTVYFRENDRENIAMVRWFGGLLRKIHGPVDYGYAMTIPGSQVSDEKQLSLFGFDASANEYPGHYPFIAQIGEVLLRGISVNGLPFIFGGDNGALKFFGFSLVADSADLVRYQVRSENNEILYLAPDGYKKMERVRGTRKDQGVYVTDSGPVINDIIGVGRYKDTMVAVSSPLPGADFFIALFSVPEMKNINDAAALVARSGLTPRVYLFSETGLSLRQYSGKLSQRPLPPDGFYPGEQFFPAPEADLALYRTESKDLIIVGSDYHDGIPLNLKPFLLPEDLRFKRLTDVMKNQPIITEREARAILLDSHSLDAEKMVPLLSKILQANPVTSARLIRSYFQNWDYNMTTQSVAPTLFNALLSNFISQTIRDELGDNLPGVLVNMKYLIEPFHELTARNVSRLFDSHETENREDRDATFDMAFLQTMKLLNRNSGPYMEKWKWGSVNSLTLPLNGAPESMIADLLSELPSAGVIGGYGTVKSIGHFNGLKPYIFQATSGYLGGSMGSIHAAYSMSTDSHSRFFYGHRVDTDPYLEVHQHDKVDTLVIEPGGN